MTNNLLDPEQSEGFFGGGNPIETKDFDVVVSPNLTPDPVDGLGAWSKEQFAQAVRQGRTMDNTVLHEVMPRFSLLTDEEIDAIWIYLQSIPVLTKQETVAAN